MRVRFVSLLSAGVLLALMGCRGYAPYVVPEEPMPPNTVMLSQMMRELSAVPGFTEAMLAGLDQEGKKGPALMTPTLMKKLRELIVGKDWQGLDRFPGWTMRAINPTVRVVGHVVAKDKDDAAAGQASGDGGKYVDLGSYSPEKAETVSLDEACALQGFTTEGIVSEVGAGVVRGDGPNASLAPMHAESQRMADVLNRLSLNGTNGFAPFTVTVLGKSASTPEGLIQALMETGHTVAVWDARYFANFGHLHYKGQDVMMPFFVNTQIRIPGTDRTLLVPVSHAEYEWEIRGPKVNAQVSWYFGIDGKAEFRTMDTQDQAWVLGRHAHEYRQANAVEVTRLTGKMVVAYAHQHARRPELPFGGYYALGVCQDAVSAIEKKMTGSVTLFPNTADEALFDDPRDAEVNGLMKAVPKDRQGLPPGPERVFGSLPTTEMQAVTIPGLSADLTEVHTAWQDGRLEHVHSRLVEMLMWMGAVLVGVMAVLTRRWTMRNPRQKQQSS